MRRRRFRVQAPSVDVAAVEADVLFALFQSFFLRGHSRRLQHVREPDSAPGSRGDGPGVPLQALHGLHPRESSLRRLPEHCSVAGHDDLFESLGSLRSRTVSSSGGDFGVEALDLDLPVVVDGFGELEVTGEGVGEASSSLTSGTGRWFRT